MTMPMFDLPQPKTPAISEPTGRRQNTKTTDPNRITWTKHRPARRLPCDHCMRDLIAAGGGPLARDARWKRKQHSTGLVLCHQHADLQHQLDGRGRLADGGTE